MTIEQLFQSINEINNGQLVFNLGSNRSFLLNKKWYPLRATVNRARALNGESELTTDRALLELCSTIHYVRIDEILFVNNRPVEIDINDSMGELKKIASIFHSLTA